MVPFSSVLRSIVTTGVKSRPLRFEIDRRLISRTGPSLLLLHIPSPATPFWVRLAMSLTGPGELRYFLLQRRQRDSTATSPKDLSSIDDESLPEISWTDAVPQQEQQDTALGGPVKSAPDQTATTTAMVDYQISRSTDLQGDYADLLVPCEDTMPVHTSDADYLQFLQNLDPALVVDELSQALDANASDDLHPTRPPTPSTAEPHNGSRLSTLTLEGLEPDTVNLVINTLLTSNSRFRMKLDNN